MPTPRAIAISLITALSVVGIALWMPSPPSVSPQHPQPVYRHPRPQHPSVIPQITVALSATEPFFTEFDRGAVPREPREYIAARMPADSTIGQLVQTALGKRGDSDRRILDALRALGIGPSIGARWVTRIDPWLAVALVDLERQVARRCITSGGLPHNCFARALAAEQTLSETLPEQPAAALALFYERDVTVHELPPADSCEVSLDLLDIAWNHTPTAAWSAIAGLPERCGAPDTPLRAVIRAQMAAEPRAVPMSVWFRMLSWAQRDGDADTALWAYDNLARAIAENNSARRPELEEALARIRAHFLVAGWVIASDWKDALRAAALHCIPSSSAPFANEPDLMPIESTACSARFSDGSWDLYACDAPAVYIACIERTVGGPEPVVPTEVSLVIFAD